MNSGWRKISEGEVFEPGRRFKVNLTSGDTYVWEEGIPGMELADPADLEGVEWREFTKGTGGNPMVDIPIYGGNAGMGESAEVYGFKPRYDPFAKDPQFKKVMEQDYNNQAIRHSQAQPDNPVSMSFDEFWDAQTDDMRKALYRSAKRKYQEKINEVRGVGDKGTAKTAYDKQMEDALNEAMAAGVYAGKEGPRRIAEKKERVKDDKGNWVDRTVKVEEEWDGHQWKEVGPRQASASEIRYRTKTAQKQMADLESEIKNIDATERLRPEREKYEKRRLEYSSGMYKRAEMERKLAPVKEMFVEPATEMVEKGLDVTKSLLIEGVAGMARGAASGLSYRKGAIEAGRKAFIASPGQGAYKESPLRPAPRSRFTTPMVTAIPSRMPVTKISTGKKIPAGEAILAKAELARKAVIAPTAAGSLLQSSVSKTPAAQMLAAPRPTRLGLSNLRVNLDTSGIRRGGALPRLKIRKNSFNEQLRRIRGLLR
jgi:hypothetical protein